MVDYVGFGCKPSTGRDGAITLARIRNQRLGTVESIGTQRSNSGRLGQVL